MTFVPLGSDAKNTEFNGKSPSQSTWDGALMRLIILSLIKLVVCACGAAVKVKQLFCFRRPCKNDAGKQPISSCFHSYAIHPENERMLKCGVYETLWAFL